MNLAVCTNLDLHSPAVQGAMPRPRVQPRRPGEPVRVLFIHGQELGFATTARSLEHFANLRPDIEAVHFSVRLPLWMRAACAETPIRTVKFGGLDFHAWRMMAAWRGLLWPFLRRGLHPERFDAVHFMTQQRAAVLPALRKLTPAALVVNSDATHLGWDREFEYRRLVPRPHVAAERRVFTGADAVACASRWVAGSVIADYGVARERVFLHMPCARRPVGLAPRRPDAHAGRAGPIRLVFVGNAWARKGGPRLLRWHQQRWSRRAELHVCSAGAPADSSCRNVVWHGVVEHDRLVRELLPTMDLFVMPTVEDTFLIAAQEAQSVGVPVVTSRLAGIPEVVLHDRTGLLCPRGDDAAFIAAVERLMDDPGLLARFSAAAALHAAADLDADVWHNHLLDQLIALADHRPVAFAPSNTTPPLSSAP